MATGAGEGFPVLVAGVYRLSFLKTGILDRSAPLIQGNWEHAETGAGVDTDRHEPFRVFVHRKE
jgi:hypothetical protein